MEKYFMRRLLCTVLLLLLLFFCVGTSFAAVVQHLPQKGESAWHAYTVANDEKSGENWRPIRIKVSSEDVDTELKKCRGKWSRVKGPGLSSSRRFKENPLCDNTTGITHAKRELLLKKILPAAIKLHTDRLSIQRKRGEVGFAASTIRSVTRECDDRIAELRKKKKDFLKADFVIFVGLAESQTSKVCSQEDDKRPTSLLIQFVPKDIVDTRHFVRMTAHEIAHGLGFQWNRMNELNMIVQGTGGSNRNTKAVHSEIMKEKMREHYGCEFNLATGMYLEDEAGGRGMSHWERRMAKDELMSPYTGEPSGMFYTALTLAAFHSMPYYSANFAMAEPMSWGNQSGCGLRDNTCKNNNDKLMNHTSMFCSENKPVLQCTSDRFSLGVCSSISVPGTMSKEYHYFEKAASEGNGEMTNDCPIIKPLNDTTCESGTVELMPGSIVDKMSRCLDVKEPKFNEGHKGNGVTVQGICAKVKCENDKVFVQYKGDADTVWHECEKDDHEIILQGSAFNGGSIVCPKYKEVCTGLPDTGNVTLAEEEEEAVHHEEVVNGNKDTAVEPESESVVRSETDVQLEGTPVSEEIDGVSTQTPIVSQDKESSPARGTVGISKGKGGAGVEKTKPSKKGSASVGNSKVKRDAEMKESKPSNKVSGSRDQSPGAQSSNPEKNALPPSDVPVNSENTPSEKGHTSADVRENSTHTHDDGSGIRLGIIGVGIDKSLTASYIAHLALLVSFVAVMVLIS